MERPSLNRAAAGFKVVKGPLSRLQSKQVRRVETERGAAILPVESRGRQHHTTAEFMIDALDERYREACAVGHSHPHRITGLGACSEG